MTCEASSSLSASSKTSSRLPGEWVFLLLVRIIAIVFNTLTSTIAVSILVTINFTIIVTMIITTFSIVIIATIIRILLLVSRVKRY